MTLRYVEWELIDLTAHGFVGFAPLLALDRGDTVLM